MKTKIMAAVLSVAALTASAQKKMAFSVRAYWDIGNKEPASEYSSDNAFYGGFGAKMTAMYKFTPQLKAGIGTGLECKDMLSHGFKESKADKQVDVYYSDEYTLLPIFIKGKYNIMKSKVSPFVSVETGMEFVVNDNDPNYVTHAPHYYAMPCRGGRLQHRTAGTAVHSGWIHDDISTVLHSLVSIQPKPGRI